MKKCLGFILLALPYIANAQHDTTKNILFVGNILTYAHNMPGTLQKMFDEKHMNMIVQQSAFTTIDLYSHTDKIMVAGEWQLAKKGEESSTIQTLFTYKWDYVVLQEATTNLVINEARIYNFEPSVMKLDSMIKIGNAKTVLYQDYPLVYYPQNYCITPEALSARAQSGTYCSDTFLNSSQEFQVIKNSINRMAGRLKAKVAPVGEAFELCRKKYPDIKIMEVSSNAPPTEEGAYLAACVFYKFFTGNKAADLKYSAKVDKHTAKKLRDLADVAQ